MLAVFFNQKVIVRTFSAGVHFGTLKDRNGREVVLTDARRIWSWFGANTLNEIALSGIDVERSRVSEAVPEMLLTEAIEIIPCSLEAASSLESGRWAT